MRFDSRPGLVNKKERDLIGNIIDSINRLDPELVNVDLGSSNF